MNFAKIIKTIISWLGICAIICGAFLVIVLNFFVKIPEYKQIYVVYILGIMMFPTILFVVLFILLNPLRSTNFTELKKIVRALNDLKKERTLKTLQELKGLANIIVTLKMEIFGKLKIVADYEDYIAQKKAETMWVLGASLKDPAKVEAALRKDITCEYLCAGVEQTVHDLAQAIINYLGKKDARKYIIEKKQVKIYYIGKEHVQFPRTFYNPNADDAEVLIYFPHDIEENIGKHPILVKNKDAAKYFKNEYNEIKEKWQWKENDTTGESNDTEILKELIARPMKI